jgi:hypothetical protein
MGENQRTETKRVTPATEIVNEKEGSAVSIKARFAAMGHSNGSTGTARGYSECP